MGRPHRHAELIKAWADGAEIQVKNPTGDWVDIPKDPTWLSQEYRIKPETIKYRVALMKGYGNTHWFNTATDTGEAFSIECAATFIKWINNWTEVEV